jgi:hypothetical protein
MRPVPSRSRNRIASRRREVPPVRAFPRSSVLTCAPARRSRFRRISSCGKRDVTPRGDPRRTMWPSSPAVRIATATASGLPVASITTGEPTAEIVSDRHLQRGNGRPPPRPAAAASRPRHHRIAAPARRHGEPLREQAGPMTEKRQPADGPARLTPWPQMTRNERRRLEADAVGMWTAAAASTVATAACAAPRVADAEVPRVATGGDDHAGSRVAESMKTPTCVGSPRNCARPVPGLAAPTSTQTVSCPRPARGTSTGTSSACHPSVATGMSQP